jgi:hypothetical protein
MKYDFSQITAFFNEITGFCQDSDLCFRHHPANPHHVLNYLEPRGAP